MAVTLALSIEGVLAGRQDDDDSVLTSRPILPGRHLLEAFSNRYKVVLLTDEPNPGPVVHWLKQHGLHDFYGLLLHRRPQEAELDHVALRVAQVKYLKGCGFSVDLALDCDPAVAAALLQIGVPAMVFAHPIYMRPEFRPDDERGMKSWADIERESEHQAVLKAGDTRLSNLYEEAGEASLEDEEALT